jgi:hypothetical protein
LFLRCIETETSRVSILVDAAYAGQDQIVSVARQIGDELTRKLQKQYPLRAKVIEQNQYQLVLDIGSRQGVQVGQRLKTMKDDWIVQVASVDRNTCTAHKPEGMSSVDLGVRLEEVQ